MLPVEALKKFWGFDTFRPLQPEIIRSVLQGHDTLALMPTGGGKSICFQVPAMVMPGICIVVSPLIALMKDQVENLRKKNIRAHYIISGMSYREIDILLDNCIYGEVKFLYVSPERIETELFQERLKKMKVSLLAVDEAHCISQWGHDFRPSYRKISQMREWIPEVPVLALTATATEDVKVDICEKLEFKNHQVFQQSYERKNLAYVVLSEENKLKKLLEISQKVPGSGIVYVNNRRRTADVAKFLTMNGISSHFYHAGLEQSARSLKQDSWMAGKTRIMVATNAFGMGIDKPDVRFVVHLDLPENLEAYYQEAGRGGRDGKKSYAVLLFHKADKAELLKKNEENFPSLEEIKNVYQALGSYFQLATGAGEGVSFDFDLSDFCRKFDVKALTVLSALKLLERDQYISVSEEVFLPSRLVFSMSSDLLYKFRVDHPLYDDFIKIILRSYGGSFDLPVKINEADLADKTSLDKRTVINYLKILHTQGVIHYFPAKNKPQLTYLQSRKDNRNLVLDRNYYQERKKITTAKIQSAIHYAENVERCRSVVLLAYFGEKNAADCGICDVCLNKKDKGLSDQDFQMVRQGIKMEKEGKWLSLQQIINLFPSVREDHTIKVIQWMLEEGELKENKGKYQ